MRRSPRSNVTVTVFDGQGGSDARAVTITVTDVDRGAVDARPPYRSGDGESAGAST